MKKETNILIAFLAVAVIAVALILGTVFLNLVNGSAEPNTPEPTPTVTVTERATPTPTKTKETTTPGLVLLEMAWDQQPFSEQELLCDGFYLFGPQETHRLIVEGADTPIPVTVNDVTVFFTDVCMKEY